MKQRIGATIGMMSLICTGFFGAAMMVLTGPQTPERAGPNLTQTLASLDEAGWGGIDGELPVPAESRGRSCSHRPEQSSDWDDRRSTGVWSKVDPELAGSVTCAAHSCRSEQVQEPFLPSLRDANPLAAKRDEKRVSITALVDQALSDQEIMLRNKLGEMQRWAAGDQARFARWFGTSSEGARNLVQNRIAVLLEINQRYALGNFRRASPSRPGVFAYVFSDDPTKIFLDLAFVRAPTKGESSRAGTITHEMSHFRIAGGTKDHAYGSSKCKALARSSPQLALTNADNFEFYVENVP